MLTDQKCTTILRFSILPMDFKSKLHKTSGIDFRCENGTASVEARNFWLHSGCFGVRLLEVIWFRLSKMMEVPRKDNLPMLRTGPTGHHYYLLPTTYYLLATRYSLLATCYLRLATYHLLLTTYFLLLTTYYLLLLTTKEVLLPTYLPRTTTTTTKIVASVAACFVEA